MFHNLADLITDMLIKGSMDIDKFSRAVNVGIAHFILHDLQCRELESDIHSDYVEQNRERIQSECPHPEQYRIRNLHCDLQLCIKCGKEW